MIINGISNFYFLYLPCFEKLVNLKLREMDDSQQFNRNNFQLLQQQISQTEIDQLVKQIGVVQEKYWSRMERKKIYVIDTSYLICKNALPQFSRVIIPYQVLSELFSNKMQSKRKLQRRIYHMMNKLENMKNVVFQSYKSKQMYKKLFKINNSDHDGHILSTALFMKLCYPFRKVILLSHDKELNIRCALIGIGTTI